MLKVANESKRRRLFASAAVIALLTAGAGWAIAAGGASTARAAAVDTAGLQGQAMPSFASVVERVKPAVVSIKVNLVNTSATEGTTADGNLDNLPPEIQHFFRQFGGVPQDGPQVQRQPMVGLGSGFFVSADGYVVTNNHVVENAQSATVTTADGKTLAAKVVGTDPKSDLAVLKVDAKGDYPFVSLAADAPKVGDWVVAIGNPYGLGGTVTAGIVSADGRDIGNSPYDSYLQIDAPINKGNSGGPTFNMKGEVVGVNTAIFSPSGGSIGLGFAIPASTVKVELATLEHGGKIERGFLGITIQSVTQDMADSLGLQSTNGAIIDQAQPDKPGAIAGLKAGDVITRIGNTPVKDSGDLTRKIGALKPGETADLQIVRDGTEKTVSVKLGSLTGNGSVTADAGDQTAPAVLGVELAPDGNGPGKGVVIARVDPNGAAASRGLTAGDVILAVGGKSVSSPEQVKADIAAARQAGGRGVLVQVKTADGTAHFVAFPFPKA
jgi:serine protease Do